MDFRGGIYIDAIYIRHSETFQQETNNYCQPSGSRSQAPDTADGMAGTHRTSTAGGFVTSNHDYFLVSRDLVEAVRKPKIWDEFVSAPHKPVLLGTRQRQTKILIHQARRKLPGEIGETQTVDIGLHWFPWKYQKKPYLCRCYQCTMKIGQLKARQRADNQQAREQHTGEIPGARTPRHSGRTKRN